MASALKHSTALRKYIVDSGFGPAFDSTGVIRIYTGSPPANADAAPTGTLLGTLTLAADAFAAADSSCKAVANAIGSDTSADASGTAGWFRMCLSGDAGGISTTALRMDGTVGLAGASPDAVIDNADIVLGGTIACSSFSWTAPT